jgi:hypothetical protein
VDTIASDRGHLPKPLQNIPAELPGVVCMQYVRRSTKRHTDHARFWRDGGRLRKQYVRKADVEMVREARRERESDRMKTRTLIVAASGAAANPPDDP